MKICLLLIIALTTSLPSIAENLPKVEILAEGFKFTEGPAVHPTTGEVYFSDIPNERTHIWNPKTQKVTTFREDTGRANGLLFLKNGSLLCCEGGQRAISLINSEKKRTLIAEKFEDQQLNSPNDLWLHPSGGLYFTDPRYGNRDDMELDTEQVYYAKTFDTKLIRITTDLVRPNGIVGTPDGKTLYIADHGDKKTYRYTIKEDGTLENKSLFANQGSDGMAMDSKGNLYLTQPHLHVYSPVGKELHKIELPAKPTNVTILSETEEATIVIVTAKKLLLKVTIPKATKSAP